MSHDKKDKRCNVCGDRALGYNFNAITCESCKAFFRRNALKNKEFKCFFNNNCVVDVVTRRFCQKCRLRKCLEIGMKKEYIMSDEEKKAKRAKIEYNRQKRQLGKQTSEPPRMTMPLEPLAIFSQNTYVDTVSEMSPYRRISSPVLPKSPYAEYRSPPDASFFKPNVGEESSYKLAPEQEVSYRSRCPPNPVEPGSTDCKAPPDNLSPSKQHSNLQAPFKILECKQPQEPQPVASCSFASEEEHNIPTSSCKDQLPSDQEPLVKSNKPCSQGNLLVYRLLFETNDIPMTLPISANPKAFNQTETNQRLISDVERIKLNELVMANEIMKQPLTCGPPDPSLTSVLNMTNYAIRRLIKMSKRISSFRSLCQEDQIALLKGGCCELLILRSVMSYEPEKECWNCPEGPKVMSIKVDVLKKAGGTVYDQHKKFIMGFSAKWKCDENIMLLLSAITLFSPDRPNVIHKEVIKLEQDVYSFLLQRYLHTIYPAIEAVSAYRILSQKLEQLHSLNENHIQMFMETNLKEIEPLLIEIFDLKF